MTSKNYSIVEEENDNLVKQLNSIWTAYESQAIYIERLRNRIVEVSPNVLNKTEGFGKDDISVRPKESALYNGLLVTWWGSNTPEAIVVMLTKNENGDLYAEGVDLGEAPLARVHRDWVASWELKEGRIRMTETLPSRGGVIDVDLSHIRPDGHWNAMRTRGAVSETGYAKVLFRPATSP